MLIQRLPEICILNLLQKEENYGCEVVQILKNIELLAVTESTVYPVLTRLKNDGYVKTKMCQSEGGPPRRSDNGIDGARK